MEIPKFYPDYKKLYEKYKEKIKDRITVHYISFDKYISRQRLKSDTVYLPVTLLYEAIINYYADIERYKHFHEIDRVDRIKIASYETYWFIKMRPIQVKTVPKNNAYKYTLINEYYCANMILGRLYDARRPLILEDGLSNWMRFYEQLMYTLHFRIITPQTLELALIALVANIPYDEPSDNKEM
jgi:hypothetical protein